MDSLACLSQDLWRELGNWLYLREITRLYQAGSQKLNSRLESVLFRQLRCQNAGIPNNSHINAEMEVLRRLSAEEVAVFYSLVETTPFRSSWLKCCALSAKKSISLSRLFYYADGSSFPSWLELCGPNFERISVEEPWYPSNLVHMLSDLPTNLQCLEMRDFYAPEVQFPKSLNVLELALSGDNVDSFLAWTHTTLSSLPALHTLRLDLDVIEGGETVNFDLTPYSSLATIALQISYPMDSHQCWNLTSPYLVSVDIRKKRDSRGHQEWSIADTKPRLTLALPSIQDLYLESIPFIASLWPKHCDGGRKALQKLKLRHSFVCAAVARDWPPFLTSINLIDTDIGELRDRTSNGQKPFSLNYALLPPHIVEIKIERQSYRDSQSRVVGDEENWEDRFSRGSHHNENRFSHSVGGGNGPYRMDEESCGYKILPCPKLRLIVLTDEARGAAFFPSALRCLPASVTFIKAIASSFIYAGSVWTDETLKEAMRGSQTFRQAVLASAPPGTVLEETSPILAVEKLVRIGWERRTTGDPAFQFVNSAKFDSPPSTLNLNSLVAYTMFERLWTGLTETQIQKAFSGIRKAINRGKWTTPAWNFATPIPPSATRLRVHGCFSPELDGTYVDGGCIVDLDLTRLEGDEELSLVPFNCDPHALPYVAQKDDLTEDTQNCPWSKCDGIGGRKKKKTDFPSQNSKSGVPPHYMSFIFFGIRSIDIWDSISTQIVALDMDRMEKTDVRHLLRKTRGFRLLTALRRLRVQTGCGSCDLTLAQLPEWLEEVVWDAGRTTLGSNAQSFSPSLTSLLGSQTLNVPDSSSEQYWEALGRAPRLWNDDERKLNLHRLVCRVSSADSFSVEELVKWRLPRLKELQLRPLKMVISESPLAIDGENMPATLLADLIRHLRVLEMSISAHSELVHQPKSFETLKRIAKTFLTTNASSSILRKPAIAFNSSEQHTSPLNIETEFNVETIKDWIKTNLAPVSFDTFSVPDLRTFTIPDFVDTINLIPANDPLLSLLEDDESPSAPFALKTRLPFLSIRRTSDDLSFVNWPSSLTKLQLYIDNVHHKFFHHLPSTLQVIHLLGTRKYDFFVDPEGNELCERFPNLEDLFVPHMCVFSGINSLSIPESCWRIVCDIQISERIHRDERIDNSFEALMAQIESQIPVTLRVLQLNGTVLKKETSLNYKKRKESVGSIATGRLGSVDQTGLAPDVKKRRLCASDEVSSGQDIGEHGIM